MYVGQIIGILGVPLATAVFALYVFLFLKFFKRTGSVVWTAALFVLVTEVLALGSAFTGFAPLPVAVVTILVPFQFILWETFSWLPGLEPSAFLRDLGMISILGFLYWMLFFDLYAYLKQKPKWKLLFALLCLAYLVEIVWDLFLTVPEYFQYY